MNDGGIVAIIITIMLAVAGLAFVLGKDSIVADCQEMRSFRHGNTVYDCVERENIKPSTKNLNLKRIM